MIVSRMTFVSKRGCMDDLVALMKADDERSDIPITRIYTPSIAPFDFVAAEWEFESLADYEKFWTGWFARPETADFMEKWYKLTENGGTSEIWNLEA